MPFGKVKFTKIRKHIGFAGLVISVIPSIICLNYYSVSSNGKNDLVFLSCLLFTTVSCFLSFQNWQGKILLLLNLYFIYRFITSPMVCYA